MTINPLDSHRATFPGPRLDELHTAQEHTARYLPGGKAAVATWDAQGWSPLLSAGTDLGGHAAELFFAAYPAVQFPLVAVNGHDEVAELRVVPWFVAQLLEYFRPVNEDLSWYLDVDESPVWTTFPTNTQILEQVATFWGGEYFDWALDQADPSVVASLTTIVGTLGWDHLTAAAAYLRDGEDDPYDLSRDELIGKLRDYATAVAAAAH